MFSRMTRTIGRRCKTPSKTLAKSGKVHRKPLKVLGLCPAGLAALLAVLGALALWALLPHGAREVAVPPDDAPPEQVVAAYVDALDGHDCDAAEGMVHDGRWSKVEHW